MVPCLSQQAGVKKKKNQSHQIAKSSGLLSVEEQKVFLEMAISEAAS